MDKQALKRSEKALADARNAMLSAYLLLRESGQKGRSVMVAKSKLKKELEAAGLLDSRGNKRFE